MLSYFIPEESIQIKVERDFFINYPSLGEIIHWAPVIGDLFVNANELSPNLRKAVVLSDVWDIVDKM